MTTDGLVDDTAGDAVAEADAAAVPVAAVVSSCCPPDVSVPVTLMMAEDVSDVHLGWTMPDGKKNSRKTVG